MKGGGGGILAATNDSVDKWSTYIQNKNTIPAHELYSADILCEVDDTKGILKSMLSEDILNNFRTNGIP